MVNRSAPPVPILISNVFTNINTLATILFSYTTKPVIWLYHHHRCGSFQSILYLSWSKKIEKNWLAPRVGCTSEKYSWKLYLTVKIMVVNTLNSYVMGNLDCSAPEERRPMWDFIESPLTKMKKKNNEFPYFQVLVISDYNWS